MPGAERYRGPEGDGMAELEPQPEASGDGGEDQRRLHDRKSVADAAALPSAKGEVRELRQRAIELGRPAIGVERFGLLPESWIAMQQPLAHDELRSGGDII